MRTVGDVAQLLGVTVRTLHYWQERGLVTPAHRTWSDYRLYTDDDVARLQRIIAYRATGMSLDSIRALLDSSDSDVEHLRRQRQLLMDKQDELSRMVQALDYLLEDAMTERKLSVDDVAKVLGDANFAAYHAEAENKYAGTDEWRISQERQACMTAGDWEALRDRMRALESRLGDAMRAGILPGSAQANALAEEHRQMLSEGYFPVTHPKHVLLGRGYVADHRFAAHYDAVAEGLAAWLHAVIDANAIDNGVDLDNVDWV